jgi:hypothetical protein
LAFRVERFRNVVLGQEMISGWGGDVIKRQLDELVDKAKLELDLSPGDCLPGVTLDQIILEFSQGKRLEPNPLGHSYCKCTAEPQDLRSAACLAAREAKDNETALFSTPDPAFAADSICSQCPHNVQFQECAPYWSQAIAHEKRQLSCTLGPLMQALSQERLDMAQAHYRRCFGPKPAAVSEEHDAT